ncbi:Phospho-2-dehydro-3-deoxyheptonate aldolase [Desulfamplus magnetovallimortis]|uniref:Phospho-2-dehydro-3-deoxyheptonate aldolase n=1 Tax=Desulfamplus magnetovallimortis TaxID=1246637 RepID=A0A1W1H9I4_9BACT|nr:3-deoxy-7-phosphoheptulonate synthase [Desulfamplus magnetovallimortis]SLM29113.1 Phospho-2-dehydro-3-deoxyheptonate aldolase [Desulfamplus magnetovallimortis]
MLIVMKKGATEESVQGVVNAAEKRGYTARPIPGGDRVSIGILHNKGSVDAGHFLGLSGVKEVIPVTKPYKLVSREVKNENTVVRVGNVAFGDGSMPVIAGPCAVESEEQCLVIARAVKKAGAVMFRGGAFKPRTSPYSFQGMGKEGLEILAKVREETGLPVVTEVMDVENFDIVEEYADVVQIGTRNMQNFSLLKRAGKSGRPVMLKRGMSALLQEWLMAAEYIMEEGNEQVILCERGIRTFVRHSRNTLDLSVVPAAKKETHLPLVIDPSHAAGVRDQVIPLARASAAVGCDGMMIEVHHIPDEAVSDGAQSLYPDQFEKLMQKINQIHAISGDLSWE